MHSRPEAGLATAQDGVVARWQLMELGLSKRAVEHFTRNLRRIHSGVWVTGHAALRRRQLWWAAAVSAPHTQLFGASAGAAWGFRPWEGGFEVIARPGTGGPRRTGTLLVCHAKLGPADLTDLAGLPIATAQRTIVDLAGHLDARATNKMVREAVRLKRTTLKTLALQLGRQPGARGTAALRDYVQRHLRLPYHRCRSDAEAFALEIIDDARLPIPDVNVRIEGEEADLSYADRRLIVEIDGPDFHLFADEDARKTAKWQRGGWTVRRVPSDLVFADPSGFLAVLASLRGSYELPTRLRSSPSRSPG